MRPKENIEEFVKVRKPNVNTSREMDKRTLDDSFSAMEQTIRANIKPSTTRIITFGRMIKLTAAAAVIIAGIGFFIAHQGPGEQNDIIIAEALDSPAKIMTMKSLKIAFRRGGVEAIESQCDKALKILGPEPASLSTADLFNGS
jgi:hypothetical protein